MKNALISPIESVWTYVLNQPVEIPNSYRVAAVIDSHPFDVAEPLFWVECADDVVVDQWYYHSLTLEIIPIPPIEYPPAPQLKLLATTTGSGGPTIVA